MYVDDMVLFLTPIHSDLQLAKAIFELFEDSSGLGCNVAKCQMVPIHYNLEQVQLAQELFPCPMKEFPISYLGLPLSTGKAAFQSLVDRMADKLPMWKGHLMHRSGHLTLIKPTLAAMPVYNAISHALMAWVIKAFVRNFRAFLWSGSKSTHNGKCIMAWDQEQRPLSLGGLGVKDLKLMGRALQLCWLWQQCSDPSRLSASIPVSDDVMTREFFKASIVITVGSGMSTLF
jgi:hypothetical protein